jgi:hypothetical protein
MPAPGNGIAMTRTHVALDVKNRTGFDYRWEYNIVAGVHGLAGQPLSNLHVVAHGEMHQPGHAMRTVPVVFRSQGDGTYTGKLAFYMPGNWFVVVAVDGGNVRPSLSSFAVFLDPNDKLL